MKEQPLTDALLRQYLLGRVDEEERQRIESLFITDSEIKERLLIVEQELTDDYLDDRLPAEDRQIFRRHYANTPAQQRRLRIAKSINDWIDTAGTAVDERAAAATVSVWSRLWALLKEHRRIVIPVAATAMIAIVILAVWLSGWIDERSRERSNQQKIARVNDRSQLNEVPPSQVQLLALTPIAVRSGDSQNELVKRVDVQAVELRLAWPQPDRYSTYRAVVRLTGTANSLTVNELKLEDDGFIRLRLHAYELERGLYQIQLTGITREGGTGTEQQYQLTVRE
jgi:anti-sigma factor RsiW